MSNKNEYPVVMLIIASLLIGSGIGMVTNIVAGVLIGLGVGFGLATLVILRK